MIERLWRFLKCECIYLHTFEISNEVRQSPKTWIDFNDTKRLIRVWTTSPPMRHIGNNLGPATRVRHQNWRHSHEGFPAYFRRSVRTSVPALLFSDILRKIE